MLIVLDRCRLLLSSKAALGGSVQSPLAVVLAPVVSLPFESLSGLTRSRCDLFPGPALIVLLVVVVLATVVVAVDSLGVSWSIGSTVGCLISGPLLLGPELVPELMIVQPDLLELCCECNKLLV